MLMEDKIFILAFSVVEKEKKVWISCSNLCGFMFDPTFQPLFTDFFLNFYSLLAKFDSSSEETL